MKPAPRPQSSDVQPFLQPRLCGDKRCDNPEGPARTRLWSTLWPTLQIYSERWRRRYRLRQSLREMDSFRVEKDIGVPLGYLSIEANKPFWRE